MNFTVFNAVACVLAFSPLALAQSQPLSGTWKLVVENTNHQAISFMTVKFSDKGAPSCMSGQWKRLDVVSAESIDPRFFPMGEPLSYQIDGPRIVIGRNEVCDGYLHLVGGLREDKMEGSYISYGISGGQRAGFFRLFRQ